MSEQVARPVGRPPTSQAVWNDRINKAREYLMGGYEVAEDLVPSNAGLACYIGTTKASITAWGHENEEFSELLQSIQVLQEKKLLNGGLAGVFNAPITKMMMTKHGYSDKIEQDNTSSDGSMTPKGTTITPEVAKAIAEQLKDEC